MFAADAVQYLKERCFQIRILVLGLLLFAAIALNGAERLAQLPVFALASALFVLSFRLWDDLADREYDRRHHPQRLLVRLENVRYFHFAHWFLIVALVGLVSIVAGGMRAVAMLGLVAVFVVTYQVTGARPRLRQLRLSVVLTKYPVFVLVLASQPGDALALFVAIGVYLLPALDEVRSAGPGLLLPSAVFTGALALIWLGLTY